MHLDLHRETATPPAASIARQQRLLDHFRRTSTSSDPTKPSANARRASSTYPAGARGSGRMRGLGVYTSDVSSHEHARPGPGATMYPADPCPTTRSSSTSSSKSENSNEVGEFKRSYVDVAVVLLAPVPRAPALAPRSRVTMPTVLHWCRRRLRRCQPSSRCPRWCRHRVSWCRGRLRLPRSPALAEVACACRGRLRRCRRWPSGCRDLHRRCRRGCAAWAARRRQSRVGGPRAGNGVPVEKPERAPSFP